MTPEQWQKVEEVLQNALDRAPHDRASFLLEACAGDEELKDEAVSLIDAYEEAGDFIEQPAIVHDARVLLGEGDVNVGREVGPYTIVERLGGGGMGEVYLAHDARLNRRVALKILPAYFASDDARLSRFQREAQAASALNHPNILTIHEVGEGDGIYYFATEFIEGSTIRELISKKNLALDEILEIAEQISGALESAHNAGIVHRDIKPENIMRRHDGLVKVLDFGIAKLMEAPARRESSGEVAGQTEAGVVMGTVDYMSPEQARALPVDQRTDIWSLGVLLFEMLTGRKPFSGATRMDTLAAILQREPQRLSELAEFNQGELDQVQRLLDKTLCKERSGRYQTAEELLADIKTTRARLSNPSLDLKTDRQESSHTLRSPRRFLLLAVIVCLVASIGIAAFYQGRSARSRVAQSSAQTAVAPKKDYAQMNEAEQLAFIAEQEHRISMMMGDRPVKLSDSALRAIKRHVDWYVSRHGSSGQLGNESLDVVYGRARPYAPLITRSFAERKVPVIIGLYLPLIESAYRNCYENSLGATGLFQFMPQTAEHYGVSRAEMCDVEKMAPAAAHYIADRMAELGEDSQSVTLVILSYTTGPDWVRNALRELRASENYERNFWTLLANQDRLDKSFRNETVGYVPRFFAAAIIGENPERFGLTMPALSNIGE